MLKLNKLTDYAMVILSYMATDQTKLQAAQAISEVTGISQPTVGKILKQLVKVKILTSARGVKGGYLLARSARQISLATVINALEGPIALTECSASHENCDQVVACKIKGHWDLINHKIFNTLESVSIADITLPAKQPEEIMIPVNSLYSYDSSYFKTN